MNAVAATTLGAAVERYLDGLRVQRRLSPHTLLAYRRELAVLQAAALAEGLQDWSGLDPARLQRWLADGHRRGLAARSLARRLSAWRAFADYLRQHTLLTANPARGLRAPKAPRRLPQVLDVDEANRLVELPAEDALGCRDRALLELFYSSALRLSELCQLRWSDLDLEDGLARIHGKGGKVRMVPVGRAARSALQAWAGYGRDAAAPVFPGRGQAPIAPRTVQQRLRVLAERQGVWKRVHPHLLRHSCASHLLESSGDLRAVQDLLGHADIGTTQIYTHLDFQHLARVYDAAHPRARRR